MGGERTAAIAGLDYERVADEACKFIHERVQTAGSSGVVFGLSGGIDSAVVAHLAARALGAARCLALIMPNKLFTPDSETSDGLLVAKKLGIRHMTIPIGGVSDAAEAAAKAAGGGALLDAPTRTMDDGRTEFQNTFGPLHNKNKWLLASMVRMGLQFGLFRGDRVPSNVLRAIHGTGDAAPAPRTGHDSPRVDYDAPGQAGSSEMLGGAPVDLMPGDDHEESEFDKVMRLVHAVNKELGAKRKGSHGFAVAHGIGVVGIAGGSRAETETAVAGNLSARLRAALLYHEGQLNNYLVAGTCDRSEYLIGYFTKYGDGASDLLPMVDLYKTQVQRLGRHLGVPAHIVEKAPSPHLRKDHDAAAELGVGYNEIDVILAGSVRPGGTTVSEREAVKAAAASGIDPDVGRHIASLNKASAHKRALPPSAKLRGLQAG